jgi:hypothetical protein
VNRRDVLGWIRADAAGLGLEGLYRISGRKAAVQKMVQDIELDEEKFHFGEQDDVHAVANILKQCKCHSVA